MLDNLLLCINIILTLAFIFIFKRIYKRGHDSQLLVACGITEPETLATMQPQALYEIIGPFAETKEGQKIIRNGKKPDLEEVSNWITWASNFRSLQAA